MRILKSVNAKTNYKLMATQLDPHFAYNIMNIINIMKNEELIEVNSALIKILQPLAENSFYHGFSGLKEEEEGRIELLIYSVDEQIVIELSDDGAGMTPGRVKLLLERSRQIYQDQKAHIGLDNIRQRLDFVYGSEYQFDIHSTEGYGTTISITVPTKKLS